VKLFDKLKDLFTDTEEIEEEVDLEEELKEEYKIPQEKLPKVMQEVIEKEEKKKEEVKTFEEPPKREERKFSFPIDFESDFDIKNDRLNILEEEKKTVKKVKEIHNIEPKVDVRDPKRFQASPVISPVYGVLDKNYTKDEVKEKDDESNEIKRASKKVDFESVRKKAFGNLTDEIKDNLICENCELYKEVKRISSLKEDDLLYDMTVDDNKQEELTIEKAYDNYEDFGVSYEPDTKKSYVEDKVNIVNHNNEKVEAEEIEIKEPVIEEKEEIIIDNNKQDDNKEEVPKRTDKKEDNISDEFFDLIDSMYKERVDEDE